MYAVVMIWNGAPAARCQAIGLRGGTGTSDGINKKYGFGSVAEKNKKIKTKVRRGAEKNKRFNFFKMPQEPRH